MFVQGPREPTTEHASSAPFGALTICASIITKLAVLDETPKIQRNSIFNCHLSEYTSYPYLSNKIFRKLEAIRYKIGIGILWFRQGWKMGV